MTAKLMEFFWKIYYFFSLSSHFASLTKLIYAFNNFIAVIISWKWDGKEEGVGCWLTSKLFELHALSLTIQLNKYIRNRKYPWKWQSIEYDLMIILGLVKHRNEPVARCRFPTIIGYQVLWMFSHLMCYSLLFRWIVNVACSRVCYY